MSEDDLKEVNVLAAVTTTTTHLKRFADPPGELEALFRENYDQIYRAAYRITGSVSDAEDVLQTVFLRLARHHTIPDFSPSPSAYLYRAAINASLDLLRTRKRLPSVPLADVELQLKEKANSSPEAQHADRELRDLIRSGISRLGERAAEIFTLRYLEGYDNREIAELIGTSQMVVAVTLHRSRSRLRKEIGKYLERHNDAQ